MAEPTNSFASTTFITQTQLTTNNKHGHGNRTGILAVSLATPAERYHVRCNPSFGSFDTQFKAIALVLSDIDTKRHRYPARFYTS
jgi:hypothetical protein